MGALLAMVRLCPINYATVRRNQLALFSKRSVHADTINAPEKTQVSYTSNEFTVDEIGFIQIALTKVLAAVARGELDLNRLAREELAARGLDDKGVWVGFDRAKQIHKV